MSLAAASYIAKSGVNDLWMRVGLNLLDYGMPVKPRGIPTREISPLFVQMLNSRRNVLNIAARRLNYAFMVAEWFWIMSGSDDLSLLLPYNSKMAGFSDDGLTLNGAYGPPITQQFEYLVRTLEADPTSRQAVLTIWRPNPKPSKDIPCTVAMQFVIRQDALDAIVYMRSSDMWLGLPYDIFTFTNTQAVLATRLHVQPGMLSMMLGSSHLYDTNAPALREILKDYVLYNAQHVSPMFERLPLNQEQYAWALREPAAVAAYWQGQNFMAPFVDYAYVLADHRAGRDGGREVNPLDFKGSLRRLVAEMAAQRGE